MDQIGSHNDTCCITSIIAKPLETNITALENFSLGEALNQIDPLLEHVLHYLPYNDLQNCKKVCQLWKLTAERILSKANALSWFTCNKVPDKSKKTVLLQHSTNLNYINASIGFLLYDRLKIGLEKYVCVHGKDCNVERKPVIQYLEEELIPKEIDYCVLSVPRVSSLFPTRTQLDTENLKYSSILDGIFIPEIPSVRTVLFHCNPSKVKELQEHLKNYIKSNEETKCLLVFCKRTLTRGLYNLLDALVPRHNSTTMALGGGIIRGTRTFQVLNPQKKVYSAKDATCIAFLSDRNSSCTNFNAFSFVLAESDMMTQQEVHDEILQFKNNIHLKKNSVCFWICCSSKQFKHQEFIAFDKLFKGVPLIGLDAYGEIGWNCLGQGSTQKNTQNTGTSKKRKRQKLQEDLIYPDPANFRSSIFVLLSWD